MLKEPIGMQQSNDLLAKKSKINTHLSLEERLHSIDISQKPNRFDSLNPRGVTYSFSDLIKLTNTQLVDLLVTIEWNQITDLFQYNDDSLTFYRDLERIQSMIDALYERGRLYTKDDSMGIETLVEVIRAGFYLGFYYQELNQLNDRNFHDRCLPALKKIATNPDFRLGSKVQSKIIESFGRLIGNASCDVEIVKFAYPILKQYNDNLDIFIEDSSIGNAIYNIIYGIDYDLEVYLYQTGENPNETMWYGEIDDFINEISKFALFGNVTIKNAWLINNGIYRIASLGRFHSIPNKGNLVLTEAIGLYPYLSEQYFWAIERIRILYGGKDANGNILDFDRIREDGKQHYLPNTYNFEDECYSIIFRTGNQVTEEKIKRLYWAEKEVKAHFFRIIGNSEPLEDGHPDNTLTCVIYNSPDEYKFNRQLYGYDTNNGGIYIENIGTLFTYERTTDQSIYSLEELFRHEFTHYLQGRYIVPEFWGEGDIYNNERLTWFEEGNAEFLAGATRTDGIVPRRSVIGGISTDPTQRYTATKALNARYGSENIYNYCFALQSFMYNQRFDSFKKIVNLIHTNDVSGYDSYRESLSNDVTFNDGYQAYMSMLKENQEQYPVPQVSNDYLLPHSAMVMSEVYETIMSEFELNIDDLYMYNHFSAFFNAFTMVGRYKGHNSMGEYDDWLAMNDKVDEGLKRLAQKEWSGYKTFSAYFIKYSVNHTSNQFEYDLVIHGINTEVR